MPKAKSKKKRSKRKYDPVANVEAIEEKITNIPYLNDINDPDQNKREQACSAIAALFETGSTEDIKKLLDAGAAKLLVQRLVDQYKPVRTAAAGALRNLTIVGGPEISDSLVEKDIMTPLLSAFEQV